LASISVAVGKDLFPDYVEKKGGTNFYASLKSVYKPEVNSPLNAVLGDVKKENLDDLKLDWLQTILRYQKQYLNHRYYVFSRMLSINSSEPYYAFHPGIDENSLGVHFEFLDGGGISWDWRAAFTKVSHLWIYKPVLYLLLSFALIGLAIFKLIRFSYSF